MHFATKNCSSVMLKMWKVSTSSTVSPEKSNLTANTQERPIFFTILGSFFRLCALTGLPLCRYTWWFWRRAFGCHTCFDLSFPSLSGKRDEQTTVSYTHLRAH